VKQNEDTEVEQSQTVRVKQNEDTEVEQSQRAKCNRYCV